jgi:hypothetical protein
MYNSVNQTKDAVMDHLFQTNIQFFDPKVVMPDIPEHHVTTEEVFLVKVAGVTRVAHLYAGRPDEEAYRWNFADEVQHERVWIDFQIKSAYSTERVMEGEVTAWARLP